jgi:hypothetical protein
VSTEVRSVINWENIARHGYEHYRNSAQIKGLVIHTWGGIDPAERLAWIKAAQEICSIFSKAITA